MGKLNLKYFFAGLALLYLFSCHKAANAYKEVNDLLPSVLEEPKQSALTASPAKFGCCRGKYCWEFTPLFDYDVTAMVFGVSHKLTSDFASVLAADVGLLWGNNAINEYYKNVELNVMMDHYSVRQPMGAKFDLYSAANTHCAACDADTTKKIKSIRMGDQVRLKGRLVNAKISKEPGETRRDKIITWDSSVTRMDTGEGSCELLYVDRPQDITILRRGPLFWALLKKLSFWGFIALALFSFIRFQIKIKKETDEIQKLGT